MSESNENNELDYILQALGHKVRRDAIRSLAEKRSLTYSELMKATGIEDSRTFGFHLRRMQKLLKKNEKGEYELNDLGWRAYRMLSNLESKTLPGLSEKPKAVNDKTIGTIVISDRVKSSINSDKLSEFKVRMQGGGINGNISLNKPIDQVKTVVEAYGGVSKLNIIIPNEMKVKVNGKVHGGLIYVKINGKNVGLGYVEEGYEKAVAKLKVYDDVYGGVHTISIYKRS